MPRKGNGGGTPFEDMSHEQMLQWLDQAKPGALQAAAQRLTAAAEEIRKIGEELKVRPQYVEWKGEGADAFRTWSGDLANATLRLGEFSEGAGKWLDQASGAVASAQVSIPRDTKGAQANLDAATAARNDPDAAAVSAKSASELAALAADREEVRLQAAAEMRKLGQTYTWSAVQMDGLERPKFPPPPAAIKPPEDASSEDLARPGTESSSGASGGGTGSVGTVGVTPQRLETGPPASRVRSEDVHPSVTEPATRVNIDSVSVLPELHQPSAGQSGGAQVTGRPDTAGPQFTSGTTPPLSSGASRMPSVTSGQGRTAFGGRMPAQLGRGVSGSTPGRGVTGAGPIQGRNIPGPVAASGSTAPGQGVASGRGVPANSGITGGRPTTTPPTGRPTGRLPGGTVVGGEPASSRGSTGAVPTGSGGQVGAQPARPTSGRFATTPPRGGIVGGTPQQTGRVAARPGAPVPSAPTRGGIAGGTPSEGGSTRASVRGGPSRPTGGARQENQGRKSSQRNKPPTAD
jgi:uncharacterized protein YukE